MIGIRLLGNGQYFSYEDLSEDQQAIYDKLTGIIKKSEDIKNDEEMKSEDQYAQFLKTNIMDDATLREVVVEITRISDRQVEITNKINKALEQASKDLQKALTRHWAHTPILMFRKIKRELQIKPKAWWGYMNSWLDIVGRQADLFDQLSIIPFTVTVVAESGLTTQQLNSFISLSSKPLLLEMQEPLIRR